MGQCTACRGKDRFFFCGKRNGPSLLVRINSIPLRPPAGDIRSTSFILPLPTKAPLLRGPLAGLRLVCDRTRRLAALRSVWGPLPAVTAIPWWNRKDCGSIRQPPACAALRDGVVGCFACPWWRLLGPAGRKAGGASGAVSGPPVEAGLVPDPLFDPGEDTVPASHRCESLGGLPVVLAEICAVSTDQIVLLDYLFHIHHLAEII